MKRFLKSTMGRSLFKKNPKSWIPKKIYIFGYEKEPEAEDWIQKNQPDSILVKFLNYKIHN